MLKNHPDCKQEQSESLEVKREKFHQNIYEARTIESAPMTPVQNST